MQFAELNGNRVKTAMIVVPYQGLWHADVHLDQNVSISGTVSLRLSGLNLTGTIYRMGSFVGTGAFRIVGGYAGWSKVIPAKGYRSLFGVKFSLLAGDAARECGEKVIVGTDFSVGDFWERQQAPASRLLNTLADQWWMGTDGITRTSVRPSPTISSTFDTIADGTNLAAGKVVIATDKPEDWLPGVYFSSPVLSTRQVSGVVHKLDKDKLRTELWTL